jgi:DegV family protein with EDD domain
MERKIAIVTDSTCDLPDEVLRENHIFVVPLRIVYANGEYRDRVDITAEQVFERLEQEIPKSSMPVPGDIMKVFDALAAEGYAGAVYLSISGGLSGSCDLARMLSAQYAGSLAVEVVDTRSVSMGLGFLALEAAREARRSQDMQSVVARVNAVRAGMDAIFVIKTLEYLTKGGRIGKVESALGTLLDIKPVISFGTDGICHTIAKARGFRNAVQKLLSIIRERHGGRRINVAVIHAAARTEADALLGEIRKFATVCESYVRQVCPVLGIYSGAGLLGIVAYDADCV